MVTGPRKQVRPRLYLKEHRQDKGISASKMAELLGIARESIYRVEREQPRSARWQAQYAAALKKEPADLWKPPPPKMSSEEMQRLLGDLAELLRRLGRE